MEPSPSPRCDDAHHVTDDKNADDLRTDDQSMSTISADVNPDQENEDASKEGEAESGSKDASKEGETESGSKDAEADSSNANSGHQWLGFFGILSRAPTLPTFSAPSIVKSMSTDNISTSTMDTSLDASLCCFKSSWKNFSLRDLEDATNKFSSENIIGEGGYSVVYKGNLKDGHLVAIKRLTRGSPEEMTADFLSELGILVHVNHPNISNVIGYGVEGGMYLVLPLSPHGSLSSILTGDKDKLIWSYRYKIALGTAQGIAYLHEGCQRRIIHRDIKAANVLLSEDFDARVSDFGLAKWLPENWPHLTVSQFEGTFGYLPPEFFMHGTVDEKTDVYAYGVLLLEIITGRMALDKAQKSVVMWARPLLAENKISEIIDPCLNGAYDTEQLSQMVTIVSKCLDPDPSERPQMSKVVLMLKDEDEYDTPNKSSKFQRRRVLKRNFSMGSTH